MCVTHKVKIENGKTTYFSIEKKQLTDKNQVKSRVLNRAQKYKEVVQLGFKDFNKRLGYMADSNNVITMGYDKLDGTFNEAVVKLEHIHPDNGDRIFHNLRELEKGENSYRNVPQSNIRYFIFNKVKYVSKSDRLVVKK